MDWDDELTELIGGALSSGRRLDCERIEMLLHEGADATALVEGSPLLHAVAASGAGGSEVAARLLLGFGAGIDDRGPTGSTALIEAVRAQGSMGLSMVRELLRRGADPRLADWDGEDCMLLALDRADEELASMLLDAGYPAKGCRDRDGRPALVRVAEHRRAAGLAFELIHRGADPDEPDDEGWTPLAAAARAGSAAMACVLISEGADPSVPGPWGLSPIAIALGARPVGMGKVGQGHICCALRVARGLGAPWGEQMDTMGLTALGRLYASSRVFNRGWMEELVEAGAMPTALGESGWSLLRLAAESGSEECGLKLAAWAMERGVDPGWTCIGGILPEDAAERRSKPELARVLRTARERGALERWVNGPLDDACDFRSRGRL